jgi:tetratricopeptide (TPR) repeat protein
LRIAFIFLAVFLLSQTLFAAEISSQEFLSSDFVSFFKHKQYEKALKASDALLKKYPHDALILRYRALTLEKLELPNEAIELYQAILQAHPNDIPARMFLGLAYIKEAQYQKAEEELNFVIKHGSTAGYRHWAQEQLSRLHLNKRFVNKTIEKRPYLLGKLGIDYDSNPLLIPDNKSLSVPGSKKASALYVSELNVGYPLQLEKDSRLDVIYIGEEYLHSKEASQVDFSSQGFALDAKKRQFLGERPFLLGARYDFRANFLTSDLYSIENRVFLSADTSFWRKTLTHFFTHFTVFDYGSKFEGTNHDQSSRDGVREGVGVTQYFYTPNLNSFFFVKGEGDLGQTRGQDFNSQGGQVLLGFHTPLEFCRETDLDVSTGFDWQAYPDFSSLSALDSRDRRDNGLDIYVGLTHHWKRNLATRIFYRYINSENNNDYFDRTRQIAGMEVIFSF